MAHRSKGGWTMTERIFRPPKLIYGSGIVADIFPTDVPYAVATMPVPWDLVRGRTTAQAPTAVIMTSDMSMESLEKAAADVPPVDVVYGIGGGSSHDMAKFIAMKQGCRVIQVPTMIGGDAAVTPTIVIRQEGRVTSIGYVPVEQVVVDFDLIRTAPPELVTVGACDALSSITAIWDWRLAADLGLETWDDDLFRSALSVIERLRAGRYEIRERTDAGIRAIFEAFVVYAEMAHTLGGSRPEEGSEHFLAYNIEYISRRGFVHGQLLAVCIAAMSYFQSNHFDQTMSLLSDMGIPVDLEQIKVTEEVFIRALVTLREFVRQSDYYYSIAHHRDISKDEAVECLRAIQGWGNRVKQGACSLRS
jgi:glycerol-1-phosphate dehydrogenase [NAD(P)+]